jgi:hypothetical protein
MLKLLTDMNLKLLVLSKLGLLILLKLLHILLQIFHLIIASLLGSFLSLSLDLTVQLLLLLLTCSGGCILFLVGGIHQVLNEVLKEQYFLDTECFNI